MYSRLVISRSQIFLLAVVLGTVTACGGRAGDPGPLWVIAPSYYRGTATIATAGGFSGGTAQIAGTAFPGADLAGYVWSPTLAATLSKSGSMGFIVQNSRRLLCDAQEADGPSNLNYSFSFNGSQMASATLAIHPGPSLGGQTSVPLAGAYSGELLVTTASGVTDFGGVTATINSNGAWVANVSSSGDYVVSGVFSGIFDHPGSLSNASFLSSAVTFRQLTPPAYSFDGTTLVVRYDYLRLPSASCWMTLTRM